MTGTVLQPRQWAKIL